MRLGRKTSFLRLFKTRADWKPRKGRGGVKGFFGLEGLEQKGEMSVSLGRQMIGGGRGRPEYVTVFPC